MLNISSLEFLVGGNCSQQFLCAAAIIICVTLGHWLIKKLDSPSRKYDSNEGHALNVAEAYDQWTEDGILYHYWGEHIHLGYYDDEHTSGVFHKDYKQAKVDFVYRVLELAKIKLPVDKTELSKKCYFIPKHILDVGCGIGGSARLFATIWNNAVQITGITISKKQLECANRLTKESGLECNCKFELMDALHMKFPDESFDFLWVCESTEHMENKERVIFDMTRVLKSKGMLIICAWCKRDDSETPLTDIENRKLQFLYNHWCHPPFISMNDFMKIITSTGDYSNVEMFDLTDKTLPSWIHQIIIGLKNPSAWLMKPRLYWKTIKDAWCIFRMHQAFNNRLLQYGIIIAIKK